jgi:HMG (high mobility group) box
MDYMALSLQHAATELQRASASIRALPDCPPEQQHLTYTQVIVSLATLQSAVSDLSRAYINHANTVLNRGPVSLESSLSAGLAGGLTSSLFENGLLGHHALAQEARPDEKKKRKRAPHDPNAPKRALTAYFLYMQHNRAQIANELGPDAKPREVADEGTRRWATMKDDDKEVCSLLSLYIYTCMLM